MNNAGDMRILLARHPTTHSRNTAPPVCDIPLGLLHIGAELHRRGYNISLYDAVVSGGNPPYFRTAGGEVHLGDSWDIIRKKVADLRPNIVGIGNQFTSQFHNAVKMAEAVKSVDPGIITVMGGAHASALPESYFKVTGAVDYVVVGEGEYTMSEFVEAIQGRRSLESVEGIVYRRDNKIVRNKRRGYIKNLDELPLPAYELIDMERYFYLNKRGYSGRESYDYPGSERSISMITSRGCPFECIFCSIHLSMGKKFRTHSVGYVMRHIDFLSKRYGIKHIHFEDDNMTLDISRFKEMLRGFSEYEHPFTWDTPNGVRADYLTEEVLLECKKTGCAYLRIGVESADTDVSEKIIKKGLDIQNVVETARRCYEIGLDLEAFYIIGFPGEKLAQMKKTVDFALVMERDYDLFPYSMFTATPLIGTELYEICEKKGYLTTPVDSYSMATATQGEGMIETEDFSVKDIKKLLRYFRLRHRMTRILKFIRFTLTHPLAFLGLLADFLKKIWKRERGVKSILADFVIFRFKNCFLRQIGRRPVY